VLLTPMRNENRIKYKIGVRMLANHKNNSYMSTVT